MKTQFPNLGRVRSVLARLGKTSRRVGSGVILAAAIFAAPLQAQIVYDATADFSITNGNPNGVWSYGWMPTDFSLFQLVTNATANNNGNSPGWGSVTGFWKNLGGEAYGVPTGWLSLHPGSGEEPCVLRWTSPLPGLTRIQGRFLPGDSGTLLVAVRMGGEKLWQATDSGEFDLLESIRSGDTIDFIAYGGYICGNTPLEAIISLMPMSGGAIFFRRNSLTAQETQHTLEVEVLRFGPEHLGEPVTVDYATIDGSARGREDYVVTFGTLHFAAGETNKLITIPILNDALHESEEQFSLVLSNPTGGVSLGSSNLVIRIQDNDPGVRFETENVTVTEAVGVVSVVVQRGDDLNLPFTVDYTTVEGAARAGEDYVAASGTLQFAVGETNKPITIPILDDRLREPWEQFGLVLSNPAGGVSLANSNVVIWIEGEEPTTYCVNVNNPNPVFPYTSWATAATNIQDAVDAARLGDTVLVTNGVYAVGGRDLLVWQPTWDPPGYQSYGPNRVAVTNAIRLKSVNGPLVTTIVGSTLVTNALGEVVGREGGRCVYLGNNAVLSGFTLANGFVDTWGGEMPLRTGGGVYSEPSGVVTNCVLTGNSASGGHWMMRRYGGGAYGGNLYNCTVTGNSADFGGGVFGGTLYNCTLTGNSAYVGGGALSSTLYNCTVTGNDGGGASGSTLYNCTVTGNNGGVSGTLYNSIVYYNYGGNYDEFTVLNYCCTSPLPTNGVGNITGPPLLMDKAAGDLRLHEASPCIDAGTNLVGFSAVITNQWEEVYGIAYTYDATDMLGNTRFVDGNFDGRVAWDMGAYEFKPFPPPRFSSPPRLTSDGWKLNLTGAPNKWVHVQRSSNLRDWEEIWYDWMGATGEKQVTDSDTGQSVMFYRAVVE